MKANRTFNIQTFGCQMNERDSETIAGILAQMGYTEAGDRKDADIAVINTCSVRENADKRFFGTLGQLKKIKEARPDFVVCVCGCMMQQEHITDKISEKYPWVDIIFGTNNIHELPELLQELSRKRKEFGTDIRSFSRDRHREVISVLDQGGEIPEGLPSKRRYVHKAFVNIMYGCNNFCTYCIVPYTRGRERSRRPEDILKEAEALAADGAKEITLLGQNVNSYRGLKNSGETEKSVDFADLIYMLQEVRGLERIRFMTSHPKDLSEKLIEAYRNCGSLCPSIHLPVQSGSNDVLRRMNRKYTREQYLLLAEKLRAVSPDICITTDIIVGFPGETEKDFEETLELCRQIRFDSAFTFLYSVRKGTPAAGYGGQIPEEVKHERFGRLVEIIDRCSAEKNSAFEGRTEKILVDGPSRTDPSMMTGRTPGFKLVDFPGDVSMTGKILDVRITEGKTFSLTGEPLNSQG